MNFTVKALAITASLLLVSTFSGCDDPSTAAPNSRAQSMRASVLKVSKGDLPSLGMAETFAVFGGGAGVTNQGTLTTINGNLGTTGASTLITGFHSANFNYGETPLCVGAIKGLGYTDAPAGTAVDFVIAKAVAADALNAQNRLAALPGGVDPAAGQLGGLTLAPGLYKSASGSFELIGSDLTLDAQGDSNAIWVFQMASTLTIGGPAASRNIILANGAQAKNVYWQVSSFATINEAGGGHMVGTILANAGISFSTQDNMSVVSLDGRALALFASVTLVNTVINTPGGILAPTDPRILHIVVTGSNATDVVALAETGFVKVINNGGHVVADQTGTGNLTITNNGSTVVATNNGYGTMTINNTATATVTVLNTGNGNVTVNATGSIPITITHSGNEDLVYPVSTGIRKR